MLGCPTSSINRRPPFWSQIAKWKWGNDHTGWPFTSLWDSWRHNMGDYPLGRISLPEFRPWRRKKERKECRCWHSSLPFNTMMAFQRCQTEKCVGAAVCFSVLDTDSLCLASGRDLTRRGRVSRQSPAIALPELTWLDQFSFWVLSLEPRGGFMVLNVHKNHWVCVGWEGVSVLSFSGFVVVVVYYVSRIN